MRHIISAATLTALALGTTGLAFTLPPSAAANTAKNNGINGSISEHARARSAFMLTKRTTDASGNATIRTATLKCEPTGGNHPKAAQVCAELAQKGGTLESPPGDTICPLIYAPVGVTATGYWRYHPEYLSRTYTNSCVMLSRTGSLFDF